MLASAGASEHDPASVDRAKGDCLSSALTQPISLHTCHLYAVLLAVHMHMHMQSVEISTRVARRLHALQAGTCAAQGITDDAPRVATTSLAMPPVALNKSSTLAPSAIDGAGMFLKPDTGDDHRAPPLGSLGAVSISAISSSAASSSAASAKEVRTLVDRRSPAARSPPLAGHVLAGPHARAHARTHAAAHARAHACGQAVASACPGRVYCASVSRDWRRPRQHSTGGSAKSGLYLPIF